MRNLVLVGFMGCGKTEVGRRLAEQLGLPFYDTDHLIQQETGLSIPQIFEQYGEPWFRELESRWVRWVARQEGAVIATGGGAPLQEQNRRALRRGGWIFYLQARAETLWSRIQREGGRPLMANAPDPLERIRTLLAQREPFYAESDWQISTDEQEPEAIADQIQRVFRPTPDRPLCIPVELGERRYLIEIAPGLMEQGSPHFQSLLRRWQVAAIVTHPGLAPYMKRLSRCLDQQGIESHPFFVPAGERSKSLHQAERLYDQFASAGIDRSNLLFALGGGVIGDLGGFVAATYLRGIPYIQVPTTLLAQVDSSVGGKVGVDLKSGKNLVGAFYQPLYVLIDPTSLHTLPLRQFRSGLAEIIKYGAILHPGLWRRLEGWLLEEGRKARFGSRAEWTPVIGQCVSLKARLVQEDEKDQSGRRALLNFGHTIGHAVESCRSYQGILHGEAVAIGMRIEAEIGQRLGLTPPEVVKALEALLEAARLPTRLAGLSADDLLTAIYKDKKTIRRQLHLVVPEQIGSARLVAKVPESLVREVLYLFGAT